MNLFGWLGKKQETGTQAMIIVNTEELPEKQFILQVDEDICKKFDEQRIKQAGLAATLDQLALQWGVMEVEKEAIWKEMRERYSLSKEKAYSLNHETGRLSSYEGKKDREHE